MASATFLGPDLLYLGKDAGVHHGSLRSSLVIALNASLASLIDLVIGPWVDNSCIIGGLSSPAVGLNAGIIPWVGLIVASPQQ